VEMTCKPVVHQKGGSLKSGCLGKHEVGMRNTVLDLRKKWGRFGPRLCNNCKRRRVCPTGGEMFSKDCLPSEGTYHIFFLMGI
jgi:hypothetical protein